MGSWIKDLALSLLWLWFLLRLGFNRWPREIKYDAGTAKGMLQELEQCGVPGVSTGAGWGWGSLLREQGLGGPGGRGDLGMAG